MESSAAFCLDLKQAYNLIAHYEEKAKTKFCVFSSPKNFGSIDPIKARKLYWCDPFRIKVARREFTGVPFVPLGMKLLDCEYGKDRKERTRMKILAAKLKNREHDYADVDTFHHKWTKKKNCPAKCFIRELVEFPEYKTDEIPPPFNQEQIWKEIHEKLTSGAPLESLRRFLVHLPDISAHCGHPIMETEPTHPETQIFQSPKPVLVKTEDTFFDRDFDNSDTHLLTLNVTLEQETAIQEMFEHHGWDFIPLETHEIHLEADPVPEPGMELELESDSCYEGSSCRGPAFLSSQLPSNFPTSTNQPQCDTVSGSGFNSTSNNAASVRKERFTLSELTSLFEQPDKDEVLVSSVEMTNQHDELVQAAEASEGLPSDGVKGEDELGGNMQRVIVKKRARVSYSRRMLCNADDTEKHNLSYFKRRKCDGSSAKQGKIKKQVIGNFYCADCDDTYRVLNTYNRHKKDGRCRFECEQCGKIFTARNYTSYLVHLKYHARERAFKCQQCETSYVQLSDLKNHMSKHSNTETNFCDTCGLCFGSPNELLSHKTIVHSADQKIFQCDICKRILSSKATLAKHKQIVHTDLKPFQCGICGKCFKTKKILQQTHAQVHKNEYSFKCLLPGCRSLFLSSEELTTHMKRHNNVPSRFCEICGQGFYNKKELKLHLTIHNGDKIHTCPYCDFRCSHAGNLTKHVKTHLKVV